jgi:molecular chaperone IbpA
MTTRTTLDLAPIQRFAVGFDQLFRDVDRLYMNSAVNNSYPPYNIVKLDEDSFLIEVAVAGFAESELDVTVDNGQLIITGNTTGRDDNRDYVHKGIGTRNFTRTFRLADHIQVEKARLENGLLAIELHRLVPEELKPRKISIRS